MPVSYAGVPLPVITAEAAAVIEAGVSPSEVWEFSGSDWPGAERWRWAFPGSVPKRPIKIQRLFWPTGASRWAVAHFLTTDGQLQAIRQNVGLDSAGGYTSAPFVLNDGGTTAITTNLWALPPRPLKQTPTLNGIHLLTLVDDRYFWAFADTGNLDVQGGAAEGVPGGVQTWAGLYAALGAALGVTVNADPVSAAYLQPPRLLTSKYQPVPALLDAVAANCGQRIVRDRDGTVHAYNVTTSQAILGTNPAGTPSSPLGELGKVYPLTAVNTARTLQGGGLMALFRGLAQVVGGWGSFGRDDLADTPPVLPRQVTVRFSRSNSTVSPVNEPATYAVTVPFSSLTVPELQGAVTNASTKTFRDCCVYSEDGGNAGELQSLAQQVATDWYRYAAAPHDLVHNRVVDWAHEGLSDSVEWEFSLRNVRTRVLRPPWNDRTEDLQHAGAAGAWDPEVMFSAMTDSAGNPVQWHEVVPAQGGRWASGGLGRQGTASVNPLYEYNGAPLPRGLVVPVWRGFANSGAARQEYLCELAGGGATSDKFPARINDGGGPDYDVVETLYPRGPDRPAGRAVSAREGNWYLALPAGTAVEVWSFTVGGGVQYFFWLEGMKVEQDDGTATAHNVCHLMFRKPGLVCEPADPGQGLAGQQTVSVQIVIPDHRPPDPGDQNFYYDFVFLYGTRYLRLWIYDPATNTWYELKDTGVLNADGTGLTFPLGAIVCDNYESDQYGRIATAPLGPEVGLLYWQGVRLFGNLAAGGGDGFVGPEPDVRLESTCPGAIQWELADDTGNHQVVATLSVNGFTGDVAKVVGVSFDNVACDVVVTSRTDTYLCGLLQADD